MKIPAKELHRLLYNAILFTDKKSATGGVAAFRFNEHGLGVMATDDHVAILDVAYVPRPAGAMVDIFLSLDRMKILEKEYRDLTAEVEFDPESVSFMGSPVDDTDLWLRVGKMLSLDDFQSTACEDMDAKFALNPDRLRKFSLLKPGDYPIDMHYGYDNAIERDLVAFKAGPTLRGILAPLDRELLAEKFGKDAGSVMW